MRPMLDALELPQVQSITTRDVRNLAEHVAPGATASLLQDLGRSAAEVEIVGVATEVGANDLAARLDALTRAGAPVTFLADVTTDSVLQSVLVEDARFFVVAGTGSQIGYRLVLREHIQPAPAAAEAGFVDADALAEAVAQVDGLAAGLDIATDFVTGLEHFLPQLTTFLGRLHDAQPS